ncbi:MAG TPA: DinB family protein [Candidatus Acidoferrales bacterium]|nr:DinB family protein [Candidatus Acidoferrales bacterium]
MADLLIAKPQPGDFAPYYARYIDLVPDGDVIGTLATQIHGTVSTLQAVSEADSLKRYAEGKWSIREVVGHMIDTERIFAYRALRFARNDQTPLPGFEQDDYIGPARFDARPWAGLIAELEALRESNLAMFRGFDHDAWKRHGLASNNPMSVRAVAYTIAGHERHHMRILRERYLG